MYRSDGDRDVLKVSKGVLIVMREKSITGSIYTLLGCTIACDVRPFEFDDDAPKLWLMCMRLTNKL